MSAQTVPLVQKVELRWLLLPQPPVWCFPFRRPPRLSPEAEAREPRGLWQQKKSSRSHCRRSIGKALACVRVAQTHHIRPGTRLTRVLHEARWHGARVLVGPYGPSRRVSGTFEATPRQRACGRNSPEDRSGRDVIDRWVETPDRTLTESERELFEVPLVAAGFQSGFGGRRRQRTAGRRIGRSCITRGALRLPPKHGQGARAPNGRSSRSWAVASSEQRWGEFCPCPGRNSEAGGRGRISIPYVFRGVRWWVDGDSNPGPTD